MTPYTLLNIANIQNIHLIPTTTLNIFWLLLISMNSFYPPLISANPTTLYLFLLPPLISTNSNNPTQYPISDNPPSPQLIPASPH